MSWHDFRNISINEMKSLAEKVEQIEKDEITNALKETDWVKAKAARKLGMTERIIGYKIKKYNIERRSP
jgi:Nif-specific regulatory protein